MEEKLIVKAEIVSYLVVKVFCNDGKEYIINFMRTNHQIYDSLKEDKDYFYKNFQWNKYLIFWNSMIDVSVDELEHFNELEEKDNIDFYSHKE